jgi:glycosyltransferase involved in cell wall biosynthesis
LWNYISNISADAVQFDFINTYPHISIEDKVKERGSKVIGLPSRKSNIIQYKKAINEFMKLHAREYDAVWLNDCMFGNIDVLKLAKKYNIKKRIVHAHNSLDMGGGLNRLVRHKINSYLLRLYATDYWACSRLAAEWSYPNDINKMGKVKIISNAVDISKFRVDDDTRLRYRKELGVEGKIVFGHVGRFHYQKNHLFLIDIFYSIHKLIPDSVLLLIGTGEDEEKTRIHVKKYGIESSVRFLGQRLDIAQLYQAMDAFLLPSLFEGLPVVLVEAQAAGLPCFVSDAITIESDISDNVEFISLKKSKEEWAEEIFSCMSTFVRKDVSKIIQDSGYSIKEAARQVQKEFVGETR